MPPHPSSYGPHGGPPSSGGTLVALDGRPLPLRRAELRVRARAGLARTVLEQCFVNLHAEPLRVTYTLPLPADGAVSGFRFQIDDQIVIGEVDRKQRARERFEEALISGRTAALVEQERSSVFTQEVGNIPPGATVVATIEIDQPLSWRADAGPGGGGWEYRFPTVVAPRYLGAEGRVPDASRVAVEVADRRRPIEMSLQLHIDDPLAGGGMPSSPSHALSLVTEGGSGIVSLAEGSAALDRDVVVRWPVVTPQVGLHVDAARASSGRATVADAFGLVTLVPPHRRPQALPRDLIVLLDTSGSMHGEPLMQAQRITCALIDGLGEHDRLELIEFSTAPRRFHRKALPATAKVRGKATKWVRNLRASGGTEMVTGIIAALQGLRAEAQRQIVLITDGQIGFEHEVLSKIADHLPAGSRVHTVGVGSAVNRSLTQAAARAGRGLEIIVGIGEDPERATARLLARTEAPLVVDLELSGEALREHAPQRLPDLFAGSPALIAARLRPEGGSLRVRGRTAQGAWEAKLMVPATEPGEGSPGVVARFGREKVEDLELLRAAGGDTRELDRRIEALGLDFQIATRQTSWIAVTKEAMVDPNAPTRNEAVPQELPYGMSVEGLGLRGAGGMTQGYAIAAPMSAMPSAGAMPMGPGAGAGAGAPKGAARPGRARLAAPPVPATPSAPPPPMSRPAPAPAQVPAPKAEAAPPREQAVDKEVAKKRKVDYGRAQEQTRSRDDAYDGEGFDDPADPAADAMVELDEESGAYDGFAAGDVDAAATGAGLDRMTLHGAKEYDDDDDHELAQGGAAPAPSLGTLLGRIVLDRDDRMVIEVDVRFALSWRPPASLVALTASGEAMLVTLSPAGTTAAAELQPGTRMRLVLERPQGSPRPARLQLDLDGRLLVVTLIG
ncbi:VIT domain-containing protein [Paraliomyxa miuraensis]|uniref:VIT domain-containing protein n=1 Tax=Paraliomyxa miuraensis TaxID=376150 RepID=UPI0022574D98|nr:VIT domain-containing protein [Paraliomyxa miuraensis]MCX4240452.1 VIT domain-containing protein [Paraliomyxa miuraensis]